MDGAVCSCQFSIPTSLDTTAQKASVNTGSLNRRPVSFCLDLFFPFPLTSTRGASAHWHLSAAYPGEA